MAHAPNPGFPFSAIVGQPQLQLALILNAISPRIGGVLVRGEKGTAKTTTIRAAAEVLGDVPLVNLPLGASEDRVIGSLDIETVLTTGKATYRPGLLAAANKGILYVDEINLLADHIVDVLLDAAATGRATIERDGLSHVIDAQFILVGSMNPEEGELRPQLLDRFGLAVDVAAAKDVATRSEIVRRRLAYEADPVAFAAEYQDSDAAITAAIIAAKNLIDQVQLPAHIIDQIACLCAAVDVEGMRADLVIARTACAHAAWQGRTEVNEEDVRIAAEFALPHRKRRQPFDEPGMDEQELEQALNEAKEQFPEPEESPEQQPEDSGSADPADDPADNVADSLTPPPSAPPATPDDPARDDEAGEKEVAAQLGVSFPGSDA